MERLKERISIARKALLSFSEILSETKTSIASLNAMEQQLEIP